MSNCIINTNESFGKRNSVCLLKTFDSKVKDKNRQIYCFTEFIRFIVYVNSRTYGHFSRKLHIHVQHLLLIRKSSRVCSQGRVKQVPCHFNESNVWRRMREVLSWESRIENYSFDVNNMLRVSGLREVTDSNSNDHVFRQELSFWLVFNVNAMSGCQDPLVVNDGTSA